MRREKKRRCRKIIRLNTAACSATNKNNRRGAMPTTQDVYYVSGSTAILAEDMGKALLAQFQEIRFREEKIPFIYTPDDARKALAHILQQSDGSRP